MKIQMRGSKIGVQKLGKSKSKSTSPLDAIIVMPDAGEDLGIIKYLGSTPPKGLEVGMKIYYGSKRNKIRIDGTEIEVMEDDNIYAIAEECNEKEES